jgi:hypothetical protein
MVSSRAKRGVRRTMGREGIGRINAETRGEALESFADNRVRIRSPAGDGEKAAVHVERRAGAWAAVICGWLKMDFGVVELERLTGKELRHALRDQLVAEPFALAEALPAVAPVRLEAVGVADAFEPGDIVEHRGEPGDKSVDRPGPAWGLALVICVVGFRDGHGRDYTAAFSPAGFDHNRPPNS